jgi:anthranilate/para-aminobenzoate synthase component II
MQVSICDFEDSFTYNIHSELLALGLDSEVIGLGEVKNHLEYKINHKVKHVIILGPGPGHPREYVFLKESVLKLMQNPNILIMGICLGHQLLWYFQGANISRALKPLHGQQEVYEFTSIDHQVWKKLLGERIEVQRYNSLAVKMDADTQKKYQAKGQQLFVQDQECIISMYKNIISYQFHPESVGTSCPQQFFAPICRFLL